MDLADRPRQPAVTLFPVGDFGAPFREAFDIEGARVGSHETPLLSREARVAFSDGANGARRPRSPAARGRCRTESPSPAPALPRLGRIQSRKAYPRRSRRSRW